MLEFQRTTNGFNYVFEKKFIPGEKVIVKMPVISPNKRGINDIGWQSDGEVNLYGTLSRKADDNALWQRIEPFDEINKTVSALKIVNVGGEECTVIIRALLN